MSIECGQLNEHPEGMGLPGNFKTWLPDAPDHRDWILNPDDQTELHHSFSELLTLPDSCQIEVSQLEIVDSPELLQARSRRLAGDSAVACCAFVEHFLVNCSGDLTPLSSDFLHLATCLSAGGDDHSPTSLRSTLKTLKQIGLPPESLVETVWQRGQSPCESPICYSYAVDFRDLRFFRIRQVSFDRTSAIMKRLLRARIPILCGLSLPTESFTPEAISVRCGVDAIRGGTAGLIVGFNDFYPHFHETSDDRNQSPPGQKLRKSASEHAGAFRFQSVWRNSWGNQGYGWLTYDLFRSGLVADLWTVISPRWSKWLIDVGIAGLPRVDQ